MIDVVGIISDNVASWNGNDELDPPTENRCGWCWEFTAPLRESDLNEYHLEGDGCCVLVAITDYRWDCFTGYDRTTGLSTLGYGLYSFNLHFLVGSDVGLNVYNEQKNHPISESKWKTVLQPLMECVACRPLDFCTALGYPVEITRWSAQARIDWMDNNYTGWTIQVQLRENNTQ